MTTESETAWPLLPSLGQAVTETPNPQRASTRSSYHDGMPEAMPRRPLELMVEDALLWDPQEAANEAAFERLIDDFEEWRDAWAGQDWGSEEVGE